MRLQRPGSRALRIACLLACVCSPAWADPVDRNQVHRQVVEQFSELDGDRDGLLQSVEAMDLSPERFEAADRDHDGTLSLVEYVDARFEEIEAPAAAPEAAVQPEGATPTVEAEVPPDPAP